MITLTVAIVLFCGTMLLCTMLVRYIVFTILEIMLECEKLRREVDRIREGKKADYDDYRDFEVEG